MLPWSLQVDEPSSNQLLDPLRLLTTGQRLRCSCFSQLVSVLFVNILWRQKIPLLLITVPRTGLSVGPDVGRD
jgi:hypothetical protein